MGQHFRVGLRLKHVALFCQLLLQRLIILDDAVVHKDTALRSMRMGILLGRLAVRGPAGVTDAHHATQFFLFQ